MKKQLLIFGFIYSFVIFLSNMAFGQEYYDATNTPRQYYYNNLENGATAGAASTFMPQAGSTASGTPTITLVAGSSLNASKSYSSVGATAIGYLQWNFMNSSGAAGLNLGSATYEWEFDYKNVTGAATGDATLIMPTSLTATNDSWRYWLIANSYGGTANAMTGLFVTVNNGTLKLITKYSLTNNSDNGISIALGNNTNTYQIRIVKSVIGYYYIYVLNRTAGTTATYGPYNVGNTNTIDLNTYNYSYLESSTTASNRFQWDNFNFYRQKLEYVPISGNGVSNPVYAGMGNAIPYGVNVNVRGDIQMGIFVVNYTGDATKIFSAATVYKKAINTTLSITGATSLGAISLNASNTGMKDLSGLGEYYYSAGNTDGTTANVINYFLYTTVKNPLDAGYPTSISYAVSNANTDTYQAYYTSGYFPYNSGSASSASAAVTVSNGAPVIAYASPQTFTVANTITPLTPVNTGGAVGNYATQVFSNTISGPSGVAVNPSTGNIFALSNFSNTFTVYTPAGATTTSPYPTTGLNNPKQLIFDAAANLYIADWGDNQVVRITPAGVVTNITVSAPLGLAVDAANNIYVASGNSILQIAAGATVATTFKTGFNQPYGVAINSAGDLFVGQTSDNTIYKIASGTSTLTAFATGFNGPRTLVFDPAGNLTVADVTNNVIKKITPSGLVATVLSGLNGPTGVGFDAAGNILVTNYNSTTVQKYTGTYYSISPALPAGLTFNTLTGIITGTPTVASATASYTVTASNALGSSTAVINITVNPLTPIFTYSTPQTYTTNTAITPLAPASTGASIGAYTALGAPWPITVNTVNSIAVSPLTGNIFALNAGTGTFSVYTAAGTATTSSYPGTGYSNPQQMLFDGAGNLFISDYGNNRVVKITAAGVVSNIAVNTPTGLATDAANNVYVASQGTGIVYQIASGAATAVSFKTGFTLPYGVAINSSGDLFVGQTGNNTIYKIASGSSAINSFATGFNSPRTLVFDQGNNLTVADGSNNVIKKITPAGIINTVVTGMNIATGVAYDGSGNLLTTSYGANSIQKYTGSYYSIGTTLPAGLAFNTVTGVISGTPTVTSPTTAYTVTAVNPSGSGTFNLTITVNPPGPAISYATPQVYISGTTISPLQPTNTGGAVGSFGTPATFTTVSNSNGIAVNPSTGNVYITSSNGNTATIYNSSGTALFTQSGATYNYNAPAGIIVDASGSTYVANRSNNTVVKTTTANVVTTLSGFSEPTALAMDAAGNIYVVNRTAGSVSKIDAAFTTVTPLITTGLSQPWGIAVNSAGDLYVSAPGPSNTLNTIYKYASGTTTQTTFVSSGLSSPRNMVVDGAGNIYLADAGSGTIKLITPAGVVSTLLSGLDSPIGVALDASGNLYATGYNFGTIYKYTASGYSISPGLPAGLNFNNSNGVISGTPTAGSPATNYTVTATNAGGSSTFTINITVVKTTLTTYAYTMPVTLQSQALGMTGNLTNFPVLVSVQNNADLKYLAGSCTNKIQFPTGPNYDIAFIDATGTELNYQIENYDPVTGTLLAWVRVPTLNYQSNTGIYLVFGSATAITNHTTAFANATWSNVNSTATTYQAVWHFSEVPSTAASALTDATGSGDDLIASSASVTRSSALIQSGTTLNGGTVSKSSATGFTALNTPLTMSVWEYYATYPAFASNAMVLQNGSSYAQVAFRGTSNSSVSTNYSGGGIVVSSDLTPSTATWHYVVYSYDGTTNAIYVDGALAKTSTTGPNTGTPNTIIFGSYGVGGPENFTGTIDEARVISTALSANWVKAEYTNQINPAAFCVAGTTTPNATNIVTIPGGVIYTYNGGSFSPNVSGLPANPSYNGKESLVFASSATLSANATVYGLTVNSGASLNLNGFTVNVGCNIYNNNNTSNGILYNTNNASQITWNGTSATQSYIGTNTTFPAQVGTMLVNNTITGATINITGGRLDVYSLLTLTAGSVNVNTTGALTLKSTATQTAAVDKITNNTTTRIDGYVNVERFLTGGGSQSNRGYRLMSSPVNQTQATAAATNTFGLSYLKDHRYLNVPYLGAFIGGTGGTGNGFSGTSVGPTIYLYKESLPLSNTGYISGKHVGIAAITTSTTPGPTSTTAGTTATVNTVHATDPAVNNLSIPVGNGFLLFFVGPSTRVNGSSALAPADATITANGYLNQGPFTVNLWYTPTGGVGKLSNSAAALPGFNMIGNPYPSTINLQTVLTDNTASIDNIYVLNSRTGGVNQNYIAYTPNGASSPTAQGFAVSGGGFIVHAKSSAGTGATLSFNEAQKVPTTQPTGTGLIMSTPRQSIAVDELAGGAGRTISAIQPRPATQATTGFYVKMEKDTVVYDYCGIYFKSGYSTKFEDGDARFLAGPTTPVTMSSLTSDGVKSAVNMLPDYKVGTRIKLNITATASGLYKLRLEDIRNIDTLYDIYLVDKLKKDSLNIRRYGVYNFNVLTTDTTTFGANRFELAFQHKAVPAVVIAAFNGNKVTEGVKLNWKTYNESNYTGFTLEKKNATTNQFEPIYEKQSDGSGTYNFVDQAPSSGNNLYRLKQNDIDGKISYSDEVKIFYDKLAGAGLFSVFPNPTVEMINVSISNIQATGTYKLIIFNAAGNLMVQKSSTSGNWTENVANLKPGTYIAEIIKSNGTSLGKAKFIKR